jgi:hypothetical protein
MASRAQRRPSPWHFSVGRPGRIDKAVPQQFWMNTHQMSRATLVDTRVQVDALSVTAP